MTSPSDSLSVCHQTHTHTLPSASTLLVPLTLFLTASAYRSLLSFQASDEHTRPVMHISKLKEHLSWGDLVLFRSKNTLSGLQRTVTTAEWDHVALVVRSPYSNTLDLLESTAEGVTAYPLVSRVRAIAPLHGPSLSLSHQSTPTHAYTNTHTSVRTRMKVTVLFLRWIC